MKKQGARVDEQLFYVSLVYTGALVYLGALSTPAIYKKVVLVYPGLVSSKRRWGRRGVGVGEVPGKTSNFFIFLLSTLALRLPRLYIDRVPYFH